MGSDEGPVGIVDRINAMDTVDFWFTLVVMTASSVPVMVALLLVLFK